MPKQPINEEIPRIADKEITCNASQWIKFYMDQATYNKMNANEKIAIKSVILRKGRIIKGMKYTEEHGVHNNRPYTSNYVQAIHEICLKYNIYSYTRKVTKEIKLN